MAGKRPDSSSLAEPQEALGFYLDSLLMDLPAEALAAPAEAPTQPVTESPVEPPVIPVLPTETPTPQLVPAVPIPRPFIEPERTLPLLAVPSLLPRLRLASPDAETAVDNAPDRPPTPSVAPQTPPVTTVDVPSAESRHRTAVQTGAPAWVGDDFQCLTFMVAGLTLAAPLERLHGIVEWPGELTELPGYADWFMGLLPNRGQNVRVIDTAQITMPGGRIPDARPVLERVNYVVLIDDGRWGLAADAIAQILTLSADGVRWRGERSKRPWLAGTAVEQMCAVLDIDNLSEQLVEGFKLDE